MIFLKHLNETKVARKKINIKILQKSRIYQVKNQLKMKKSADFMTDSECACQELSNEVSHASVALKIRKD